MRSIKTLLLTIVSLFFINSVFAIWIPDEYYSNYKISSNWEWIMSILVKIKAADETKTDMQPSLFSQLNKRFKQVFQYLPWDPNYKIVYEQCLLTTNILSTKYDYIKYLTFKSKCFEPINKIVEDINENYSVEAKIVANPSEWSAPLVVTFDARNSKDPSNDTIPSDNYFWYFKDVKWNSQIIWKWPVVTYTFNQAWSYVVHLTVRSVNNKDKWVFDWDSSVNINVWPKSAIISAYVNWKKLQEDYKIKVWTQEATSKNWISIDWSGTVPTWWRKIKSYKWTIEKQEWSFDYSKSWNGNPWAFRLRLPSKWEYSISLSITDNQNNNIKQIYYFVVSDPIATIKYNPEQWTTSTIYNFDASLSYSFDAKIKSYKWTLFDPNWNKLEDFEWKTFQKKFIRPWNYTIKLVVLDELWNTNEDQIKLFVDSTPPIPQFNIEAVSDWKYPSQFVFDAWSTYDVDQINWVDTLKYDWKFWENNYTKIEKNYDNNRKVLVSFDEPWTHEVRLMVTDRYNKIQEIQKTVEVKSSLRPIIVVNPLSVIWWNSVTFNASSNKTISHYIWNFGDETSKEWNDKLVSHVYRAKWVYRVKLTAITPSWEENEVITNVFVWEKWYPIWSYDIKIWDKILLQNDICVEKNWDEIIDNIAYSIDRYQDFIIDSKNSVNTKWLKWSLKKYYKPQNDEMFNWDLLNYKFSELWCQYVEFWVEDQDMKKIDKKKIWFKVKNSLPKLNNLIMSFPQYWNEMWIWINQSSVENKQQDQFVSWFDPLIVKINAQWVSDSDSQISHYIWYYYKKDNPDKMVEIKLTPWNIPYVVFAVPKIPWEFVFWVKIADSDDGEIRSEDIIWYWPSLFFSPDTKNNDIPIVTLKISQLNARVWEEVKFTVRSKIISEKSDFTANRIIKFDFDWDGNDDLTTKKDEITYIYNKPWTYKPKVRVIYRWYAWRDFWDSIQIKKWLKAWFMYDSFDKTAIIRDVSYWDIEKSELCIDMKNCKKDKNNLIIDQKNALLNYEDYDKYYAILKLKDKYWNDDTFKDNINIEKEEIENIWILSVPNIEKEWDNNIIEVWNILNNSVLFYIKKNFTWDCYIDSDISIDSDWDWNIEDDKDFMCEELKLVAYEPSTESLVSRIYYEYNWKKLNEDITVNFLDINMNLSWKDKKIYEDITSIISMVDKDKKTDFSYLKTLLLTLRSWLWNKEAWDRIQIDSTIIQINSFLEDNIDSISKELIDKIQYVIQELKDDSVSAAMWWNKYQIAKSWILNFIPSEDAKKFINDKFKIIEASSKDKEIIKSSVQDIYNKTIDLKKQWSIQTEDFNKITIYTCDILHFYDISSTVCGDEVWETKENSSTSTSSTMWTILKVIFWILWILFVIFIILIIIFAVKARKNQQNKEEPKQ
jgi:PKD repeat protein